MSISVRNLSMPEVRMVVDWAATEGWNPGVHDAETFYTSDNGAFFGGFLGGELAAAVSVTRYSHDRGFLGFYICRPDLRGGGLAKAVWDIGVARLEGGAIGLDAVPEQEVIYQRSGFKPRWRNIRFAGQPKPPDDPQIDGVTIDDDVPDQLMLYDQVVNGHARSNYFATWLSQPGAVVRIARMGGSVAGYAVRRPCRSGWKIGPIFADRPEAAEALVLSLTRNLAGEVAIDAPEPNTAAIRLAQAYGLTPVSETRRMYRGPAPVAKIARCFGLTSLEFG